MDKLLLQQQVLERLAEDLLQAEQAARAAHKTATHEENVAENKYDTLGLEAAYLATGQARRADTIRQAFDSVRRGGRLCVVGYCMEEVPIPVAKLMYYEIEVVGSLGCPPVEYPRLIDLVAQLRVATAS